MLQPLGFLGFSIQSLGSALKESALCGSGFLDTPLG